MLRVACSEAFPGLVQLGFCWQGETEKLEAHREGKWSLKKKKSAFWRFLAAQLPLPSLAAVTVQDVK